MDYEKKYKEALERARAINNGKDVDVKAGTTTCEYIFPELVESEDGKIREELLVFCRTLATGRTSVLANNIDFNKWIAWLEKQESVDEIVSRCKNSWYNEGKIAGMAEGLTDDERYQQGWHDALEKQGKTSPVLSNSSNIGKDERKPNWSEEDERNLQGVIDEIEANKNQAPDYDLATYDRFLSWLKSLKERIGGKV